MNGNIQSGCGFITNHQFRPHYQRASNRHTLPLATRKLALIGIDKPLRKAYPFHHLLQRVAPRFGRTDPMNAQGKCYDGTHRLSRIERGIGILEDHLHAAADRAAEKVRLRRINRTLIGHGSEHQGLEILGTSPPMKALRERITQLARSDASGVLILGETGTGKRRVARLIHDLSLRVDEAYIEATAASDDPQAFENSVFGIEGDGAEGMVTSQGLIGISDRGSLQLSNITAAPLATQSRLDQALENHAYRRSGSSREVPVDLRLLASTTEDPDQAREQGRLDEALYYRLKPMSLTVPPIRQMGRNDQIAILARELAAVARSAPGAPTRFTDEALERLLSHPWPGNFREVRALLERATMQARGREEVGLEHFPAELRSRPGGFDRRHTPLTIEEMERMHIERTLKHHKGNRTRTAKELGISRATLITKIRRYAIPL